jgi:hypothetical protein
VLPGRFTPVRGAAFQQRSEQAFVRVEVAGAAALRLSGVTLGSGVRLGGRYRLDVRVGAGGMGEVWRGTDEVLGRTIDAWPIPTPEGSSTDYLHCVAGSGETTGSYF